MDFKEQIVDRAIHRAMHARGVVVAAGELQALQTPNLTHNPLTKSHTDDQPLNETQAPNDDISKEF